MTCSRCGGAGLVWSRETLRIWKAQPFSATTPTAPPNQWRDQVCECSANNPPLRRGKK